ncbi:SP_0009 family protein [Streptococcus sp. DD12]|nr:SP_0009 family protein [Streptococcus sp. DD12]KXT76119.1 hypothetical protein STRDD12_01231 [Streptococcus sp. DD12]
MTKLIDTIAQFLAESEEHLDQLAQKNQAARQSLTATTNDSKKETT